MVPQVLHMLEGPEKLLTLPLMAKVLAARAKRMLSGLGRPQQQPLHQRSASAAAALAHGTGLGEVSNSVRSNSSQEVDQGGKVRQKEVAK
jgi:hypothetical protein